MTDYEWVRDTAFVIFYSYGLATEENREKFNDAFHTFTVQYAGQHMDKSHYLKDFKRRDRLHLYEWFRWHLTCDRAPKIAVSILGGFIGGTFGFLLLRALGLV